MKTTFNICWLSRIDFQRFLLYNNIKPLGKSSLYKNDHIINTTSDHCDNLLRKNLIYCINMTLNQIYLFIKEMCKGKKIELQFDEYMLAHIYSFLYKNFYLNITFDGRYPYWYKILMNP